MQALIDDNVQVDSIVTDPPYGIHFMGKNWDSFNMRKRGGRGEIGAGMRMTTHEENINFQNWCNEWASLCLKLLKPGGYILAFSSARTYHHLACGVESAGFQVRDQIMWLYGSGFPKSLNIGKAIDKKAGAKRKVVGQRKHPTLKDITRINRQTSTQHHASNPIADEWDLTEPATPEAKQWEGWGTALKPAHEPIVMARKPLDEKTVAENVLKHGTGGINIDECRIGTDELEQFNRESFAWEGKSLYNEQQYTPSEKGRFPANVIHDGSEEVLEGFPYTKSGMMKQHIEGGQYNVYGKMYPRDVETIGDEGSAGRFFYCPKVSRNERNMGLGVFEERIHDTEDCTNLPSIRTNSVNTSSGKQRKVNPTKNHHPTVKPLELMKYLCRLVTPKGGTVLDPFMGSGSTGMAAKDEGFEFIGIEKEKEYFEIAESRIKSTSPLLDFLS
jgi:site-specific DNA-methyltransferase (adenine-specific)